MPVIIRVEADSVEDAQKALDEWSEEVDLGEDLPIGTEDIDVSPSYELNDEGQRVLHLPALDESSDEDTDSSDSDDDDDDDFNEPEDNF